MKKEKFKNNSSDKNTIEFTNNKKESKKRSSNSNENLNKGLKSKKIKKVKPEDDSMKERKNNFLGRKRKTDKEITKSKPSKNKPRKIETPKRKTKRGKASLQIDEEKQKSKTPKQNNKSNNLFIPKMNIDEPNSKEKNYKQELTILNQLISDYGFDAVLDSLCDTKSDPSNKLESCLQDLKNSCYNDKLPLILFKMFYSYFDSKIQEIKNKIKRSTSSKISTPQKNIVENEKCEKSPSKSKNGINLIFSIKDPSNKSTPMKIDDVNFEVKPEIEEEKGEMEKNINNAENNQNQNKKNTSKEDGKIGEKNNKCIGSHYNKDKEGNIYKYQVANLDGKGNAIFKCYDERCCGMGIYEIETDKFIVSINHSLKHEDHEFIINNDKDGDGVFKELIQIEKCDAQIFKENGERIVKFY